jgi:hypothetical protein
MAGMSFPFSDHSRESGAVSGLLVAVIGLSVLVLGLGSFGIWAFVAYEGAQSNLDEKIQLAQAQAKGDQADADQAKYAEQVKTPYNTYTAPADYCSVSFQYPKTWSVYESEQVQNGGDFKTYFYPKVVPPVSSDQQYALRLWIRQSNYDSVVSEYQGLVQKGSLKSSSTASEGQQGTRLDGDFNKNIRGSAVIYPCRDKTIMVFTDANTFGPDFETLIKTISYNN